MNSALLLEEKQAFRQWWLYLLIITINGIFIFGCYIQLFQGKPFGNNPMNDTVLIIVTILLLLISTALFTIKLIVRYKTDGIYIHFFPLLLREKRFLWKDIRQVYVRKYKPLSEFGGWGLRNNFWGLSGKAYNTSGTNGVQLVLNNGHKVLIGTQIPEKISQLLTTKTYPGNTKL